MVTEARRGVQANRRRIRFRQWRLQVRRWQSRFAHPDPAGVAGGGESPLIVRISRRIAGD